MNFSKYYGMHLGLALLISLLSTDLYASGSEVFLPQNFSNEHGFCGNYHPSFSAPREETTPPAAKGNYASEEILTLLDTGAFSSAGKKLLTSPEIDEEDLPYDLLDKMNAFVRGEGASDNSAIFLLTALLTDIEDGDLTSQIGDCTKGVDFLREVEVFRNLTSGKKAAALVNLAKNVLDEMLNSSRAE